MKKVLIVSFALALVLGIMPIAAFACVPTECTTNTTEVVSDTDTKVTKINDSVINENAVLVTPTTITNQYWTADVGGGAQWIWSEDAVENWNVDKFVTFEKTFEVNGAPLNAILDIAADNSYEAFINGVKVSDANGDPENNHQVGTQDQYNVLVNIHEGTNTLTIVVKNWAQPNGSALNNPGGLLYKLVVTSQVCPTPCCGDVKVINRNVARVSNNVTVTASSGNNSIVTVGSGTQCQEHSLSVVSDTTNTVLGNGNAVAVTYIHTAWTASIPGATWIWSVDPVANPTQDEFSTFEKQFNVSGDVTSAVLDIASDNSYIVWINGILVGQDASENNFSSIGQDQYTTTVVAALQSGANTIKIEVKNWALGGGTQYTNPAGLLYKLVVNSKECSSSSTNSGNITTGSASAISSIVNVVNTNRTRIRWR